MFCCCIERQSEDKVKSELVDVEKILQDFVWNEFISRYNRCQRLCLRRSNFDVDVPMNHFHFETIHQSVKERKHPLEGTDGRLWRQQLDGQGKEAESEHGSGRDKMELKTSFYNATPDPQTYQFRLEKTRKATVMVTVQRGFTVGGKANFTLKLPSVTPGGSVGTEFDMRYSITKTRGENIEETATFETRSDIKVKENSVCDAKVLMTEVNIDYDFRVKTLMTLLPGGAPATVKRKRDGRLYYTRLIQNISRIFEPHKSDVVKPTPDFEKEKNEDDKNGIEMATFHGEKVLFKIYGVMQGARLSDQRIALESSPVRTNDVKKLPCSLPSGIEENGDPVIEEMEEEEKEEGS